LYPAVYARLDHLGFEELKANRANGHPAPPVTEVFADEVFRYLEKKGILRQASGYSRS